MNLKAKDADSTIKYFKSTGSGTSTDPFIVEHLDSAVLAQLEELVQSISQPPTTRKVETIVLTSATEEKVLSLNNAKIINIVCANPHYPFRFDTIAGNTINNGNYTDINTGQSYSESNINFSGNLYFSLLYESDPIEMPDVVVTQGSSIITSPTRGNYGLYPGQFVVGNGIPLNTQIQNEGDNATYFTLNQNATTSGTVSLTISGVPIRVTTWS